MSAMSALLLVMWIWMGLVHKESRYLPVENVIAVQTELSEKQVSLHAQSAVLIDGDSGRILYGKNEDQIRPMASTTKIMTCIIALENGNLSDICTVSQYAAGQPKVHLGAPEGTQILLKDLLYSLMLESHNDSAVVIAEHIAGSVEAFAGLMNQKARDLGCTDTFFVTPNGLDASVTLSDGRQQMHSTTAADLARIMRYCIQESPASASFLEITAAPSWYFQDVSGRYSYSCSNHNALLVMTDGALSGKTGFTSGAGYSYVGAVEDEGRKFVIALLGCGWPPHKTWKWEDARALLNYGADHFYYKNIYEEPELGYLKVDQAADDKGQVRLTAGVAANEKEFQVLLSDMDTVRVVAELPQAVCAPVHKGEVLGTIRYELNGETIRLDPVCAAEDVDETELLDFLFRAVRKILAKS